jgi:hypothetical protein
MKELKKKPIQIYIEPQQDDVLAALAQSRGISKAEIIRESLDRYFMQIPVEEDPAMGLVGLGNSGKNNLSESHDACLAEYVRRKSR